MNIHRLLVPVAEIVIVLTIFVFGLLVVDYPDACEDALQQNREQEHQRWMRHKETTNWAN